MTKVGFIGCGNMAQAIIGGIIKNGTVKPTDIIASDVFEDSLKKAKAEHGIKVTASNVEAAGQSDLIFIAVKPYQAEGVIKEIAAKVTAKKVVVSMATGIDLKSMEGWFGKKVKLVRIMPNTPALVNAGMTAASPNASVTEEETEMVRTILGAIGRCEVVPESLMDAVLVVSGSAPAYVYMFIEAMADAAVLEGMSRPMAYTFAAQTVMGSAKMVMETGMHPGALKDMVCSPGGTTIEAVAVLEERGFRSAVIEAMRACAIKGRELGS